ncbi:MAG TPA: hypothetical protein VK716_15450 [Terracidiphilus sp.]|nr:hypothetical protein [Terracidiphilus sp.]
MIVDVLFRIHADPLEYLGCRSLDRLIAYELGYGRPSGSLDCPIEAAFREWIIKLYRPSFDSAAMDVFWILQRVAPSDEAAYELFFRHLETVLSMNTEIMHASKPTEAASQEPLDLSCFLDVLGERPGFYLPRVSVGCLRAFLDGKRLALIESNNAECNDLDGFDSWIRNRLSLKGLFRWENAVLQHFGGNESDAYPWCIQELKAFRKSIGPPSGRNLEVHFHQEKERSRPEGD